MNFVKAKAAVEHLGKQLAQALDAVDKAAARVEEARTEAVASVQRHHEAMLEAGRLHNEWLTAEAEFASCQGGLASTNGEAGGAAFNATIRIDPNPETDDDDDDDDWVCVDCGTPVKVNKKTGEAPHRCPRCEEIEYR